MGGDDILGGLDVWGGGRQHTLTPPSLPPQVRGGILGGAEVSEGVWGGETGNFWGVLRHFGGSRVSPPAEDEPLPPQADPPE